MRSILHHSFHAGVIAAMLSLWCVAASAQTCSGTWGKPLVNQTFGQGTASAKFFGPLSAYAPGATTTTNFLMVGPNDNESCLTQNASNGQPGNWVNKKDHTGDAEGLMMIINPSSVAGQVVFEYTMQNLCPNTLLQFSMWVLNINTPAQTTNFNYRYPNMLIKLVDGVSGAQIDTISTGNILTDATWHNYTLTFNNGASSSIKFQIINKVGTSYGNDFAIDDITVKACVPVATIAPKVDTTICTPRAFSFNASIAGTSYTVPEYIWEYSTDSGKTWQTFIPAGSTTTANYTPPNINGEYWVRYLVGPAGFATNSNCATSSDTCKIRVNDVFDMTPIHDTASCYGKPIQFTTGGAATYSWSPAIGLSCANCANPIALPEITTLYTVIGEDYKGCFDTLHSTVRIDKASIVVTNVCPGEGDGVVLAEILNAPSATYTWFDKDANQIRQTVSATGDRLENVQPGEYIVNMKAINTCDTTVVFPVEEYVKPEATFALDPIICIGQKLPLINQSKDYSSLTWDMGDGTNFTDDEPAYAYQATGDYTVSLIVSNEHCSDTMIRSVSAKDFELQLATNGDSVVYGQPLTLQTSGTDGYSVTAWYPTAVFPDQGMKSQTIAADESRSYTVWAISQYGCVDSASAYVGVKSFWFIADAFTPNGDGKNDYFRPVVIGSNYWELQVYDRWGKTACQTSSASGPNGWDGMKNGTPADMGVYFYVINIATTEGIKQYKGEVTLIR